MTGNALGWLGRIRPHFSLGTRFTVALLITVVPIVGLAALSVQGIRTNISTFVAAQALTETERIPILQLQGALRSGPGIDVILGVAGAQQAYARQQGEVSTGFLRALGDPWDPEEARRLERAQQQWQQAEQFVQAAPGTPAASRAELVGAYMDAIHASRSTLGLLMAVTTGESQRALAAIQQRERHQIVLALLAVVVALAAALGAAFWLRWIVVGRVRQLVRAVERLERDGVLPTPWPDELGEVSAALAAMWQAVRAQRAQLRHRALHDPLTGLGNRRLATAVGARSLTALITLDLNNFKAVNDVLGHAAGDRMLRVVARRLTRAVRPVDTVVRLGGDEFAVLVHDPATRQEVGTLAQRLVDLLAEPVRLGRRIWSMGASVGIALAQDLTPADGGAAALGQRLLTAADVAMYDRKQSGSHGITFYEPSMQETLVRELDLERSLTDAVECGGLTVHYQPFVKLGQHALVGVEALVRWQHPTCGLLEPGSFIPLAERSDLIVALGWSVLDSALGQVAIWRQRDLWPTGARLAVNIAPGHFTRPDFVAGVRGLLQEHGLPGSVLTIEITETTAMVDIETSKATLRALRELSIQVAIDDFGTGYTTLGHLAELQADIVKIDRSFLQPEADIQHSSVVLAILALARSLHFQVVAEGVETSSQEEWLRSQCCDMAQGFLFARPLPSAEFETLVLRPLAPTT